MRSTALIAACLLLPACVSTQMRQLVGSDISEAHIRYGQPINVIEMPDGRRAYQFAMGGGPVVVPGYANTAISQVGPMTNVSTSGSPGYVVDTPPCALTFIAQPDSGRWRIVDYRAPKNLTC